MKLLKGVAGLFFELLPPNLVEMHIFGICTNGDIMILIALKVSDLAKISLSQTYTNYEFIRNGVNFN